ncbi:HAD-IA family hydrolase [Methylobacterium sp. 092160098-2]|uniref:HAD-IA family hydrolase n=1 Tax=Methylobacterium sp. 092160098-2 TaxID=3025129 RepID=UPI002381BC45|nr:HAD-IA family hydrolase [Methylobacterium sp. 092160098-2]MDE4915252.1 HAD-IA family hydrolase [Methylobacterium sp. 092160098-2]
MSEQDNRSAGPFRAVAFDLLTALMDSWSLWVAVAGEDALGRRWRRESLQRVTTAGAYRPYEVIVREAAQTVGLTQVRADELLERWASGELRPWPEAHDVLVQLASEGWKTAVVTNCSQRLAEAAASATGHAFDAIVSAERAGVYKTDPRAYQAGLAALGNLAPVEVLFVAGSAHDVPGAGLVGMPVYWSNRFHDKVPAGAPLPLLNAPDLRQLPGLLATKRD